MTFSLLLYTRNNANQIYGVLNSIKEQTVSDFECIILDDNSTDASKEIYSEFLSVDLRFKYIVSQYDINKESDRDNAGISNILNSGIQYSTGDYIVLLDTNNILPSNFLEQLRQDISLNPTLDVLCYNREFGPETVKYYFDTSEKTINDFLKYGLPNIFGSVINRKTLFEKLPWFFRQPLDKIFDTQFFLTLLSHSGTLGWSSMKLINKTQNKSILDNLSIRYIQMFLPNHQNKDSNEMTVLITFRDEGYEVEKTVIACRLNDQNINIQLVNDASTDDYDYQNIAKIFGCDYIRNETSQGVAGTRCIGVDNIKTPYFIIFDAHMRFKIDDKNFSKMFLKELKKDPNQILYANTIVIHSNADEDPKFRSYINEDCYKNSTVGDFLAYGAVYHLEGDNKDWDTTWCYSFMNEEDKANTDTEAVIETISILGATYAMSKTWWNKIHGLEGLYYWGNDEPWLSVKTTLLGGKCRLFKNFGIGHIYRNAPVYGNLLAFKVQLNRLMMQYVLSETEEEFKKYVESLSGKLIENDINLVLKEFENNLDEYKNIKEWLWKNSVKDINYIKEFNKLPIIHK